MIVTTNTVKRIVNHVHENNSGTLSGFEDGSVNYKNNEVTKFLNALWDIFCKPFSRMNTRLDWRMQVQRNFASNVRAALFYSEGESVSITASTTGESDGAREWHMLITLITENNNVYCLDRRSKEKSLIIENCSVSELRSLCRNSYLVRH